MPITVNEGGVLHELTEITANEGGTLYNFDTVHENDSGVLLEIHSSLPQSLTWTVDTSKDSAAKINSVSADGLTITFMCSDHQWAYGTAAVYSNFIRLPAGAKITSEFSNLKGSGSNKHYRLLVETSSTIVGSNSNNNVVDIAEAGMYRLTLWAFSVTGSQSGMNYYSCTATVKITITK